MAALEDIAARLVQGFDLHPVIGIEIEWYIRPKGHAVPWSPAAQERESYLDALRVAASAARLATDSFDEERGPGQFEAALSHTRDLEALLRQLHTLHEVVADVGFRYGYVTDFSVKPYPDSYGSGQHVHVHLENRAGENVFTKQDDALSPELTHALAGLLADLPRSIRVFAPHEGSAARFQPGWHAPVKACWGTNNRTTALRLPDASSRAKGTEALARIRNPGTRRIEHRVAGSDADTAAVTVAVLEGVLLGLQEQPVLSAPVYGDAGHEKYDYPLILGMIGRKSGTDAG